MERLWQNGVFSVWNTAQIVLNSEEMLNQVHLPKCGNPSLCVDFSSREEEINVSSPQVSQSQISQRS